MESTWTSTCPKRNALASNLGWHTQEATGGGDSQSPESEAAASEPSDSASESRVEAPSVASHAASGSNSSGVRNQGGAIC